MSYKFSMSTISTLVEWLENYGQSVSGATPEQFIGKQLEKELFEGICSRRDDIELLLKTTVLDVNTQLIVHLHLMLFYTSKLTSLTILESLKQRFTDDEIKILMSLINDEQLAKLLHLQQSGDRDGDGDKRSLLGNFNELKEMRLELHKSRTEMAQTASSTTTRGSTVYTSSSENKLNQVLLNFPTKKAMKPSIVAFKKNTASILRAGAVVTNKMRSNDSMVEKLANGSSDPAKITKSGQEFEEEAHAKAVKDIERKHLLGLISLEEAKLAKIEAVKNNQLIAGEMKKEHQMVIELAKEKQEQQIINSKQIIRSTHLGRLKAKRNHCVAIMKKKSSADEVKTLNNTLQKQLNEAREMELQRKTELIQKMKNLESQSKAGTTEKTKQGDYQKMSVLELKESIANFRKQLDLEKEVRQKKMQQERERQKQVLATAETMIEYRHKLLKTTPKKIKQDINFTPDLIKLREKLAEMRQLTAKSTATGSR